MNDLYSSLVADHDAYYEDEAPARFKHAGQDKLGADDDVLLASTTFEAFVPDEGDDDSDSCCCRCDSSTSRSWGRWEFLHFTRHARGIVCGRGGPAWIAPIEGLRALASLWLLSALALIAWAHWATGQPAAAAANGTSNASSPQARPHGPPPSRNSSSSFINRPLLRIAWRGDLAADLAALISGLVTFRSLAGRLLAAARRRRAPMGAGNSSGRGCWWMVAPVLRYAVRRSARVLPVYGLGVAGAYLTAARYTSWPAKSCLDGWWLADLVLLSNFLAPAGAQTCLPYSWAIANIFELGLLLTPPLAIVVVCFQPERRRRLVSKALAALLAVMSAVTVAVTATVAYDAAEAANVGQDGYAAVRTRISMQAVPFALGIVVALVEGHGGRRVAEHQRDAAGRGEGQQGGGDGRGAAITSPRISWWNRSPGRLSSASLTSSVATNSNDLPSATVAELISPPASPQYTRAPPHTEARDGGMNGSETNGSGRTIDRMSTRDSSEPHWGHSPPRSKSVGDQYVQRGRTSTTSTTEFVAIRWQQHHQDHHPHVALAPIDSEAETSLAWPSSRSRLCSCHYSRGRNSLLLWRIGRTFSMVAALSVAVLLAYAGPIVAEPAPDNQTAQSAIVALPSVIFIDMDQQMQAALGVVCRALFAVSCALVVGLIVSVEYLGDHDDSEDGVGGDWRQSSAACCHWCCRQRRCCPSTWARTCGCSSAMESWQDDGDDQEDLPHPQWSDQASRAAWFVLACPGWRLVSRLGLAAFAACSATNALLMAPGGLGLATALHPADAAQASDGEVLGMFVASVLASVAASLVAGAIIYCSVEAPARTFTSFLIGDVPRSDGDDDNPDNSGTFVPLYGFS